MHQPDPEPTAGAWRWVPLLLVAVAWLAHASVRNHGWVLDDVHLVRDNPLVARGPAAIPEILRAGASGAVAGVEHGAHGPLAVASFALEAPLWQRADGSLRAPGFHLTNLLLHGLCVLLCFRVGLAFAPRRPVLALGAALVLAAHPLHTGTISTLMGRAAILATLLSLATALAWHRWGGRKPTWLPLALLAWLGALLAHPAAIGVPLVLWLLSRRASADAPPAARLAVLAFALPLALWIAMGGGTPAAAGDLPVQGAGARLLIGLEGYGRALLALIAPVGLRGDHTDEAVPAVGYEADAATWIAVGILLVVTLLLLVHARRRGAGTATALWFAGLALAVPAALVLPAGATLESRWAYVVLLPAAAYGGLLAEGLLAPGRASPAFARARGLLLGALALACMIGLAHREAAAWKDDDAFHEHLLERNPRHVRAMVRHAESQRLTALRWRTESTAMRTDDPQRGLYVAAARDALDKADTWSRRAVRHELGRDSAEAWRTRGFVQLAIGRSAAALKALEQARDLDPALKLSAAEILERYGAERLAQAAEMYEALARARESLGYREPAADAYLNASRMAPGRVDLQFRAGVALCRVKRYAEGLPLLDEALRRARDPDQQEEIRRAIRNSKQAARRIAERLIAEAAEARLQPEGRGMSKAITLYEQATEANPRSVEAWTEAGFLRGHWMGNYVQAERNFQRAESILRAGRIPQDDGRWQKIAAYRELLREQKAEEDAEEARAGGG